jgi:hypothetical protein
MCSGSSVVIDFDHVPRGFHIISNLDVSVEVGRML